MTTNYHRKLMLGLQKYIENQLSTEIIIPLLLELGHKKVEFFGGPGEDGKDIIIWSEDRFKDTVLFVAQVKRFKFTAKAADTNGLQTIVNQLIRCFARPIPSINMQSYYPLQVLLITPYEVDSKTLLSRFNDHPTLKDQNIKIIDGIKLAELIVEFMPEVAKKILGVKYEFLSKSKPKFNNNILLKALGKSTYKDITTIYSDIDFSIGKLTTSLFFYSQFSPQKSDVDISIAEWFVFKGLCENISDVFDVNFLDNSLEFTEKKITPLLKKCENIQTEKRDIEEKSKQLKIKIKNHSTESEQLESDISKTRVLINSYKAIELKEKSKSEIIKINKLNLEAKDKLEILTKKINTLKESISNFTKEQLSYEKEIGALSLRLNRLKYPVNIDGVKLVKAIILKRNWMEQQIIMFNKERPSSFVLKDFITKCHSTILVSVALFDEKQNYFMKSIGVSDYKMRKDFDTTRFKLPIEDIFDTGLNISILGDAGAGKSTSMEMYVCKRADSGKLLFFFPLGYVVQEVKSEDILIEESLDDKFITLLLKYLRRMELDISISELEYLMENESCVFFFDGLDEAIKIIPELPSVIKRLADRNPKNQFILSSRMYGSYIDDIPFFSITLLPFTEEQRNNFISQWFQGEENAENIINTIDKHLKINKEIADIVRNPLLTTTLCVLAENKLNLPRTEIKLYDERLKLLTGYYDNVKHIVTRINSTPSLLELVAQKIAYYLHTNNTREDSIENLKEQIFYILRNHYNENEILNAINDLISPCEILVPMSPEGKYGLGHLRYQEHLAAKELQRRNIDLIPLLSQEWWYGSIILFSRMTDNVEWLIHEAGKKHKASLPIIEMIISARHKHEAKNLYSLVDKYKLLKALEKGKVDGPDNEIIPGITLLRRSRKS